MTRHAVLCVDDQQEILEGLQASLRRHFDVYTALSGANGLELLERVPDLSVVISDMRMPQMNGAEFLSRCRGNSPNVTRILLTGYSDMDSAIEAVNGGSIYRFLTKPCPRRTLIETVQSAVEQHELFRIEREMLDNTVKGAVKLLTDMLSMTAPQAFSRSIYIQNYVEHMTEQLRLQKPWIYQMAAMLSYIGCVALPPDVLAKAYAEQSLSDDEQNMWNEHPAAAATMIRQIPRLELAAEIVARQNQACAEWPQECENSDAGVIAIGGALLRTAILLDRQVATGKSLEQSITTLNKRQNRDGLNPDLLELMTSYVNRSAEHICKALPIRKLQVGMTLDEDVMTTTGLCVCQKGTELTPPLLERLRNFANGVGINQKLRVRIPT